jgi:hypothetical protein
MAHPDYPKLREQLISFLEVRAHHRPEPAKVATQEPAATPAVSAA